MSVLSTNHGLLANVLQISDKSHCKSASVLQVLYSWITSGLVIPQTASLGSHQYYLCTFIVKAILSGTPPVWHIILQQ